MSENKNKSDSWWKRHKDAVFSSMVLAIVGYFIGSYCQEHFEIGPKVEALSIKVSKLDSILSVHTDDARLAIDHIVYNTHDGVECKVGINTGLSDNLVSMSKHMANLLGENEVIFIANRRTDGSCIYVVPLRITEGSTNNPLDSTFYVSENTLRRLGVEDKNPKRKGIYKMSYKRNKKRNP